MALEALAHHLQHHNAWKIQNGRQILFAQKNKFLDPITPSMRKVDSGGEKPGKKENNAGNSPVDRLNANRPDKNHLEADQLERWPLRPIWWIWMNWIELGCNGRNWVDLS